MTEILFVRHGETDWNVERRVQGHSDRPLNATGKAQARKLATELRRECLDAIYASDLARARETAQAVAEQHGLEVEVLPALREKHFGTWEGLLDTEIRERFPQANGGPWGDGETSEEVNERVLSALHDIAARHPGGRVLVVSHGGPLRAVLRHCDAGGDEHIANCHVARIGFRDGNLISLD
ncbi:MAG: histidine phosphatase family protein [Gaiellaceae bacterium MAG52_C11]|nr:histidine phosphatase family protein [Candidatus Gaiellasilicea maunaloa]